MDNQSITHTRWNCTYHIVFIPKYRRKIMKKNHVWRNEKGFGRDNKKVV